MRYQDLFRAVSGSTGATRPLHRSFERLTPVTKQAIHQDLRDPFAYLVWRVAIKGFRKPRAGIQDTSSIRRLIRTAW